MHNINSIYIYIYVRLILSCLLTHSTPLQSKPSGKDAQQNELLVKRYLREVRLLS